MGNVVQLPVINQCPDTLSDAHPETRCHVTAALRELRNFVPPHTKVPDSLRKQARWLWIQCLMDMLENEIEEGVSAGELPVGNLQYTTVDDPTNGNTHIHIEWYKDE